MRFRFALLLLLALASYGFAQPIVNVTDDMVTGKSVTISLNMSSSDASMGKAPALDSIQLRFRCNNDGLDIYLRAEEWTMFAGYPANIVYRFAGGDPTPTHDWGASTTGYSVFLPASQKSAFLSSSLEAESIAIRWSLAGGMANKTLVYDLREFQGVAGEHLAACR